ncbi:hypothetical protein GCM10012275_48110 [Longimycelium tulufanense]|uniref:Uncharacterized protein n=1 Tax=Longimycelium tulufanense TaxID=907463 RepID=A0A8J3FXY3_9PSEU|nr:hypothetical protein [Longimycelium tulufanense]GGM71959.1 hypothetical protein GCM10012275_48110 [Longimycelium tulufanense]
MTDEYRKHFRAMGWREIPLPAGAHQDSMCFACTRYNCGHVRVIDMIVISGDYATAHRGVHINSMDAQIAWCYQGRTKNAIEEITALPRG